jgi:diguanylate cyclase (GGDEF)-like protein/PAS domain S-box-containing protein
MPLPTVAGPVDSGQGLENYLRAEQISLLTLNREDQSAGVIAIAVTAGVLHHLYPAGLLALWAGLSSAMVLLCVYLSRRCNAAQRDTGSVNRWARIFTACATITGLLWGMTGTAILLSPSAGIQSFVIVLAGGILAGGINGNAAYRPALLGLGLGLQIPVIIAIFACGDALHTGIGVLVMIFSGLMLNGALKFNGVIADNIRMRFAQEQLLAQLQSSQAAMADAQQLAKAGSWSLDLKSQVITLSAEAYRIFGVDPANPTPHFSLVMTRIHPEDQALVDEIVALSLTGTAAPGLDHRLIMDDGTIKHLHITPKTIFDGAGQALRVGGSVLDVTDRRLTQERLQAANVLLNSRIAEQRLAEDRLQFANILLKTQMEASRDGILVVDREGKITGHNKRYGEMSNARFDDLLGLDVSVAIERFRASLKDAAALQPRGVSMPAYGLEDSEAESEMADGRIISRYTAPLTAAGGDYLGRVWFFTDITERKQAENILAYRDRLLHTVTAATAVAVSALSLADGVNAALAQIGESMGVDRIIVMQKMPEDIPPLAVRFKWESSGVKTAFNLAATGKHQFDPKEMSAWRAPLEDGKPVAAQLATAHGAVRAMMALNGIQSSLLLPVFVVGQFWGFLGIDTCADPRDWAASEIETVGILADITGSLIVRERARVALATSEQRFRLLTSAARDAVTLTDETATIRQWNAAAAEMFGYSADEALGKDIIALLGPRGRKAEIARILGTVNETAGLSMEFSVRRKDGSEIAVEIAISAAKVAGRLEFIAIMRDITERKTAEQKLQFVNTLLGTQMEASPDGILVVDADWTMVSCNRRFAEIWHLAAEHLAPGGDVARRAHIFAQVAAPDADMARVEYLLTHAEEIGEDEVTTKDGRTMERFSRSLLSPAGEMLGRVWFFSDVTARKAAEQKLLLANTLLKTQMEAAPEGIYIVGHDREILSCNQRFADMWSLSAAQMQAPPRGYLRAEIAKRMKDPEYFAARILHLNQHPEETGDDILETNDGRVIEQHSVSLLAPGRTLGRAWFYRDITARRAAEALALRLARYDALTGLANRTVFVEAVNQAIAHARRERTGFAVLFLDLDHFKDVNDTLGHPAGDALLKAVAARLLGATRETDTVGRFGGDEFAVVLAGIADAAAAGILAEKLLKAINIPLVIERNTIHVRASIGVELFSPGADDSETLLAHADLALYRAKAEGRGTFRFFTAGMDRDVRSRVTLGTELREALAAGELFLLYQPQFVASTGAIAGVEALIRWRHPVRGLLAPEAFIEAAETTGAIIELGHFVLWTVCRQAASWAGAGHAPPRISFNVSALQFKSSLTLEADIMAALAETGIPPWMLELELTEAALMSTSQENSEVLRRLKEHGVKLAIDDFGTGYSSLEYLRRFPADHIKIARIFTKNVTTEASDAAIVRAIISLANELKIATIAEGIETSAQLDLIAGWGCTQMQGFYLARPVPAEAITDLLKSGGLRLPAPKTQP